MKMPVTSITVELYEHACHPRIFHVIYQQTNLIVMDIIVENFILQVLCTDFCFKSYDSIMFWFGCK